MDLSPPPKPSLIELDSTRPPGSLVDHIYGRLKQAILTCILRPGSRIIEKEIIEELEVSRTPLREAINRLCLEGLIIIKSRHGFYVRPITIRDFQKNSELRKHVEPNVAATAAVRAREADIDAMKLHAPLSYDPDSPETYQEYCRANCRFHLAIVRSIGNQYLEDIVMSALDRHQQPAYLGVNMGTELKAPNQEHEDLVQAIEARDADAARAIMHKHLEAGESRIFQALRQAGIE